MKVILRADVNKLGSQGDIKEVSSGYARNFLLPHNFAWEANEESMKRWEREKIKLEKKKAEIIKNAKELAGKIEKISMTIPVKIGESGKVFGSITNADIQGILKENDFSIDKRNIVLKEPLKEVGVYTIEIKIHPTVVARPKVWLVEEKEEKKEEKKED